MTDKEREANANEVPIEDLSNEHEMPQDAEAVKGGATSSGGGGTQQPDRDDGIRMGSTSSN